MSSMITTTAWVPRGFAAPFPTKYNFDEEEFERIAELAKLQLDDANEALEKAQDDESETGRVENTRAPEALKDELDEDGDHANAIDDDLKEYDLEHYDDDVNKDEGEDGRKLGMFGNIRSLAYYENNDHDPYITFKDDGGEEEEREELQILATDNLLLAAKVEDELAHLEVYVYEDSADNLYVHHDIMLPAIPLCLERLDIAAGKTDGDKNAAANYVAIGTFDPDIEIWNLDMVDCMYPNAVLGGGGNDGKESKKKKKKKSKKANDEHHVDAVLSLAANRQHRNLLASASADRTIKLWDLHVTKCARSYSYHTDKICSLAWHPVEATVLLSGSYDRTAAIADMRAPTVQPMRAGVESDVENVRWDPHDANYLFVSTENGLIHYHDARKISADPTASRSVWKLQAHDETVSSFDLSPVIPGFLATGSTDKTVKLWNISPQGPSLVVSRDLDAGKVFSASFAPDTEVAFRLAVAGSKGTVTVWDTSTNYQVRKAFSQRFESEMTRDDAVEDRLVAVNEYEEDSSSEGEGYEEEEVGLGRQGSHSMDGDED